MRGAVWGDIRRVRGGCDAALDGWRGRDGLGST
jgi:hypothetical protein